MSKTVRLVVPFALVLACGPVPPEALSSRTCSTDAECPSPSVDCAQARCNPDTKSCEVVARDLDGDGERASQCAGTGIVLGTDCDDSNVRINSAAQERCDTASVDENCNGSVNEGCACRSGATRECCSGRGVQACEVDGGSALFGLCSATVEAERCNAIDDDCDGTVDDAPSFTAQPIDGGTIIDGASCVVGVGACATFGAPTCELGTVGCDAIPGVPSAEVCNSVDDDCNGSIDDDVVFSAERFDGGLVRSDGTCTSGVGACARDGQARCAGGALGCSAVAASPDVERCNLVDDDCDGTVDDDVQFSAASLDGGALFEDGGCSVGLGACRSRGVALCTNGAVGCSAVALDAGVEQCNGIDDDCDGTADELPGTLCGSGGQTCLSGVCGCTGGQSVCGSGCATLGGSCIAGVGACRRTGTLVCSTSTSSAQCSVTAGAPSTEVCDGVDNDCDGMTDEALQVVCHPDPDGDNVPTTTSAPQTLCRDAARAAFGYCPSGFTAYTANPDCAPNDASAWRTASTGIDSDNDSHCAPNSVATRCFGTSIPAPYKLSGTCLDQSDCDDARADRYRNVSVRTDGDNDFYCVGGAYTACVGANPSGVRPVTECRGDDCKDDNGYATATCRYPGFRTVPSNKRCDIGVPPSETINAIPNYTCGTGFGIVDVVAARTSPAGACAPAGTTAIHMGCNGVGIGTVTCYLDGWCQAL